MSIVLKISLQPKDVNHHFHALSKNFLSSFLKQTIVLWREMNSLSSPEVFIEIVSNSEYTEKLNKLDDIFLFL